MFERFTMRARTVVIESRAQARDLHARHIGTEHLLLAMLRPEAGAVAEILRGAGLRAERVRAEIVRLTGESARGLGDADAAALEAIGIDLNAVRAKLEEAFGPGALEPDLSARHRRFGRRGATAPFTPRAKKVLELSLREALRLKHRFIATEHILLGLLREGDGLAAQIIADAGVDRADLRRRAEQSLRAAA